MSELLDWLQLLFRWFHVVAAIAWIGHAFLFNEWDDTLVPPDDPEDQKRVQGELWMVHGGGFYQLIKHKAFPERLRGPLHWFKWEAAFTWLSGFGLLVLLYYMGGGILMVDPTVAALSPGQAIAVGIGTLLGSWLVYDLTWVTVGPRAPRVAEGITVALIVGMIYTMSHLLSGRAAFLHTGAMLATWMAANVWVRIIPGMTRMVGAMGPGQFLDAEHGKKAKQRSKHNNYFIYPVILTMISNHYPATYGHPQSWLVLISLMAIAVGLKHWMNLRRFNGLTAGLVGVGLVGLVGLSVGAGEAAEPEAAAPAASAGSGPKALPEARGSIRGVVSFEGTPPEPKLLTLSGGCELTHKEPVLDPSVRVQDGKLANSFVWIKTGWEGWQIPAPTTKVTVDQVGCVYNPHVVGAQVGQTVVFTNSDALFHNVRAVSSANPVFNEMTPTQGARFERVFKRPEVMVQTRCDVHPWMSAYVGVVPHPWFAVSGADGAFSLEGVPPGTYTLEAWHEVFGSRSFEVVVEAGGVASAAVTFAANPG